VSSGAWFAEKDKLPLGLFHVEQVSLSSDLIWSSQGCPSKESTEYGYSTEPDNGPKREIVVAMSAQVGHSPSIGRSTPSSAATVSSLMRVREHAVLCEQRVRGRNVRIDPDAGSSVYLGTGAQVVRFRDTLATERVV